MPKKEVEINPLRGKRVKELLSDNGVSQKTLANRLGYTEQHISLIVKGKRNLPLDIAQKIADMFPLTRFEWLMGFDDFKTIDERISSIIDGQCEINELIKRLMAIHGYTVIEEQVPPDLQMLDEAERLIYNERPYTVTRYAIVGPRGDTKFLEYEKLNEILSSINDYVDFKCARSVARPFDDYLHTRKGKE